MKGTKQQFPQKDAWEGTALKFHVEQSQSFLGGHKDKLETHMPFDWFNPCGL